MRHILLIGAALIVTVGAMSAAHAQAQFSGSSHPRPSPFFGPHGFPRWSSDDRRDGHGRDGHRHGSFDDGAFIAWAPEAWALYNNRSWDSDSYNDWWHDRPDRAYPRWIQHNQNCTPDRMWWSGSGWHC